MTLPHRFIPMEAVSTRRNPHVRKLLLRRVPQSRNALRRKAESEAVSEVHEDEGLALIVRRRRSSRLYLIGFASRSNSLLVLSVELGISDTVDLPMKPAPFCEEVLLVLPDDPEGLPRVRGTHVVVLPEGGASLVVPQANENFSSVHGFHVDVRRLVLSRGRVYVDLEAAVVVDLDHAAS